MKSYHNNVANVAKEVHHFFYHTYNNIYINGPQINTELSKNSGLMITCTHRSMADYYLLGMLLHELGIGNLRFAAGDNLTKLPIIGPKFRAFGAFDIERDNAFRRSYIKKLREQVVSMIEDNDNIIVFPEGGRSYNGSMLEIKGGVLAAAVVAQARNPEKQIMIMPVAFSYERVYELPYFPILQKGKDYRKKTNPFFKRRLGDIFYFGADIIAVLKYYFNYKIGRKQGNIFIDYGKPVNVNDIIDIKANYSPDSSDDLFAHKASVKILGEALRVKLLELYRLLPMHIVACTIKEHPSLHIDDIQSSVRSLILKLSHQKRNTKSLDALSDEQVIDIGIKQLSFFKAVEIKGNHLKIKNHSIIDYFAAAV
jgi:1-acyl-sn-glycerol-3-phosphate acyltransferase